MSRRHNWRSSGSGYVSHDRFGIKTRAVDRDRMLVDVDFCLLLKGIVAVLSELVSKPLEPAPPKTAAPSWIPVENRCVLPGDAGLSEFEKIAKPSVFTCPECHGSLWEIEGVTPQRFRCNTGHAFSARALASGQDQMVEDAIWAAIRAPHEKETLLRRFAKSVGESKHKEAAAEHEAAAEQASKHAQLLRKMMRS